jgi:hypothetical protein
MTTNSGRPGLTRRGVLESISAIAVGLIATPAAAHLLMEKNFAAEAVIDEAKTLSTIVAEPFLVTFLIMYRGVVEKFATPGETRPCRASFPSRRVQLQRDI